MANTKPTQDVAPKDKLTSRTDEPLPTPQDPKAPRGGPADPKPVPPEGQGTDPKRDKTDYTA
jgi:hypothetical protein